MKVVNRCVEPLVQATFWQNVCLRHALKEMAEHNQYTGNNFYIIDPFFSYPHRCLSTHLINPHLFLPTMKGNHLFIIYVGIIRITDKASDNPKQNTDEIATLFKTTA